MTTAKQQSANEDKMMSIVHALQNLVQAQAHLTITALNPDVEDAMAAVEERNAAFDHARELYVSLLRAGPDFSIANKTIDLMQRQDKESFVAILNDSINYSYH